MPKAHAITGIAELLTNDLQRGNPAGVINEAAIVIEDGVVVWTGSSTKAPAADTWSDVDGRTVLPGFVDSHAHLMFAGDRAAEFAARMSGEHYSAGGIRTTVAATRAATDDELRANAKRLATEMLHSGITTFEIKSGYGLTVEDEARSLRIASEFTPEVTFLGAHVVPAEFEGREQEYVDLVAGPMLDACDAHARWIDAFCDRGAFDVEQARTILQAGTKRGLGVKLHANQLQHGGGVQLAVEMDAASADHCTHLDEADIAALADSSTVATLVPGAEFSTRSPFPDARRLLNAGVHVAIATDCNPGSSYTTSMPFCIALAVREMHMTPTEAVIAATRGGAAALRRTDVGHLTVGARADLTVLNAPSHIHLAYRPGVDLIAQVWRAGNLVYDRISE